MSDYEQADRDMKAAHGRFMEATTENDRLKAASVWLSAAMRRAKAWEKMRGVNVTAPDTHKETVKWVYASRKK